MCLYFCFVARYFAAAAGLIWTSMTDANSDLAHSERWSYAKLSAHIAQKGWQMGSAIACAVGPGLWYFKAKDEPLEQGIQTAMQAAGYCGLAGIGFAGALTTLQISSDPDGSGAHCRSASKAGCLERSHESAPSAAAL